MATDTVSILEGNMFVVSDTRGDIDASPTDTSGLFAWDMRYLSRWILTVNGLRPNPLSTDDLDYFAAQFFLVPGTGTIYVDADISLVRKRYVGDGFHEELIVFNHAAEPVDLDIRLEAAADFADLFQVKDALTKKGATYSRVDKGHLVLGYRRETFLRETWVIPSEGAAIDEAGVAFKAHIEPHEEWHAFIDVVTAVDGMGKVRRRAKYGRGQTKAAPQMETDLQGWLDGAPQLVTDWLPLQITYRRSLVDLAALRFFPKSLVGGALPAAGLPWFMTIFGRDSIITSLQALPFAPELARSTLLALAQRQGRQVDDFRDEQPGKIMHEVRFGEMTAFEERPHSPYYGAADTTPLFLVALDEYERWSGDGDLVRKLESAARAALRWIDEYGDSNGDGYVDFERRNTETGLENQYWKDSWNSCIFRDGTLSSLPRATCEIQGYVYDAKVRTARLARLYWEDEALAQRLESEAAQLKQRFNRDYWIADREFFALAIDGDGRQVDSLTSNIGHLLWSGIVEDGKAEACVGHLLGPKLYSGWGVRTMADGEAGYNPIGYHVGTVWPFDNSIIAWGLRRYGYPEAAARVALGILEAAQYFRGRLPEAFAGYERARTRYPVEYPTSCSPQAWSTGAPLLLLRTMLGLEPTLDHLLVVPAVPTSLGRLELLNIPGRWGLCDAFGRGRVEVSADEKAERAVFRHRSNR